MSIAPVRVLSICQKPAMVFLLAGLLLIVWPQCALAKSGNATSATSGAKININTADSATLQTLPGIGRAKAEAIMGGRPYVRIEDIMKVKGIKQKTFEGIRDHIEVR